MPSASDSPSPRLPRQRGNVYRDTWCGEPRPDRVGAEIRVAGWVNRRRDHGGLIFIDLRDRTGVLQLVFDPDDTDAEAFALGHRLRSEDVLSVGGQLVERSAETVNPELPTGAVELRVDRATLLSDAETPPFEVEGRGASAVGEETRLRYRYLDLRRSEMQQSIELRARLTGAMREALDADGFLEIETPVLTRSTPEGARDFLVPSRLQQGSFYALPQSPQLFKQLLMVGGMERYYQLARCYRDEDFRKDRQPEFTQLDIEMSFVEQSDVVEVGEEVVAALWREVAGFEVPRPIPHLTYHEAMARFGSDKPDLRFGLELVDLTSYFASTPFRVFQAEHVGAIVMPGGGSQSRKELDGWQEWAKARGAKGLAYALVGADGELGGPVAKNISAAERDGLVEATRAAPGDAIFFAAGTRGGAQSLLGMARLEIGRRGGLIDESQWSFVWVVDAPMFEWDEDGGRWNAVHHPFTSPNAEWADRFQDSPGEALAYAYDIVCNGNEIGGGSIRIHRAEMQQRVFDVLGIGAEEAQEKFGFLLDAFQYGPPPHGGIAFGWDRVCMLLAGVDSLRDVIAFPKTGAGYDPLTGAPTPITPAQRKEAGIDVSPADAARAVEGNAPRHGVVDDHRR